MSDWQLPQGTVDFRNEERRAANGGPQDPSPPIECLDGPEGCKGEIEYRMPLSPTGRAFPRCDHHWGLRLDKEEKSMSWQSDVAPSWLDPTYAGEQWEDE